MKKLIMTIALVFIAVFAFTACGAQFDPESNIAVVAREDGSGTKTAFMEIIGLKGKADPTGTIKHSSTAAVMAEVKGNMYAIGYESLGYVTSDVKALKIDGVEPTVANIINGTYKIARPLSIVYKEATLDTAINQAFYDFLMSSDAQTVISEEGYVSTKDGAAAYVPNTALTGTIKITGSTSLQPLMEDLVAKFKTLQPNVTVTVGGGGSGTGYNDARNDVSTFGMISEVFSNAADKGAGCVSAEVAKDGIAVIVNKANALTNISMADLKNIYNTEETEATKLSVWSQVLPA